MAIDLARLTEAELVELNRRIVERLQLIRAARGLTQPLRFSVGMVVEFTAEDGRVVRGAISRLERPSATVVTTSGPHRVLLSALRVPSDSAFAPPLPPFGPAASPRLTD